jgi:hypothetical protein
MIEDLHEHNIDPSLFHSALSSLQLKICWLLAMFYVLDMTSIKRDRDSKGCEGEAGYRDSREKGIRNPVDPVY